MPLNSVYERSGSGGPGATSFGFRRDVNELLVVDVRTGLLEPRVAW